MIRSLLVFGLLLVSGCSTQRDAASHVAESESIFRHVDLGAFGRFELGEPFGDHVRLAVEAAPNTFRLRDRVFGGAESVVVTTDGNGIVRHVSFEYGPDYDYPEMLASYSRVLGPPAHADQNEAVWNDGYTEFTLTREAGTSYAARATLRGLTDSP